MKIGFSSSFKRAFKKKIKSRKDLETKFWQKVEIFMKDPFDRSLRTHKLSGKLKDLWSFSLEYDLRVIFYFAEKDKVVFVDIGKHDEVY
ncbi:MAG TPA: type II toxin-antitoxin system mRNA interferase toxin, RelE/StbE family [Thermosulfurimonas dismutans]|uniref:Type II toxin-antitoxin system mRNA interferase toxin, RelE/StbE family n=1 Tax=Thermosulfurimonas dismutans TaxID=999894 RepID=A0A7C3GJY3_9BACT|nr:type II toxin-antitoxin system mRNA interferase toxin, RelE/StbE family [Thermosulfurimonas dismutans]